MKRVITSLIFTLIFTTAPVATSLEPIQPKIGIAYDIGFLGDNSYNDAVHSAVKIAKRKYKIEDSFIREIPTSGTAVDRLTKLRFLARSGYTLIIVIGEGYRETVRRVSIEYPETQFALMNDRSIAQLNVSNIYFSESDSAFLAGVIAAMSSKRAVISLISDSDQIREAFKRGASFSKKKVKIRYISYDGNQGRLIASVGRADIVYSTWDRDGSLIESLSSLAKPPWFIGRVPDQYFIEEDSPRVLAVIRKDIAKPISTLLRLGLQDRALIDVIDEEEAIFGREYRVKNGAITVTDNGKLTAETRKVLELALRYLRK